ncbi:MAG: diguanylate cyclase [Thermoanaerobacteraceae bacterium]|nr:diguanylate cyclase [Thermoanaerobacteraceae bacterium]
MENDYIFRLEDVYYSFNKGNPILKGINLTVRKGDKIALLGSNGTGKSTLLKILDGLIFPEQGNFIAFGEHITEKKMMDEKFACFFRQKVGFVFQDSDIQLFCSTVWEEVAFGPVQLHSDEEWIKRRVDNTLKVLGLYDLRDRPPYTLSGGEKKKVAIASVLVMDPDVLLFDEPTNELDPKTKYWFIDVINKLNKEGKTIIISTHHLEMVPLIAESIVILTEDHELITVGDLHKMIGNMDTLLEERSMADPLTGVYNRRYLEICIDFIKGYFKYVFMVDIDHFKNINDTYGHDIGDLVLKETAKICAKTIRSSDRIIRFGGEEFLIFLATEDDDVAYTVAERIRKNIEEMEIRLSDDKTIKLTISVGCTKILPNEKNLDFAIKRADEKLYKAKNTGRNKVIFEYVN